MANDDNSEKKFGRTMWDVIDGLLKRPIALAILSVVVIGAIVLALLGNLQVSHSKDGWDFCFFSCEKNDIGKNSKRSFRSLLKVPLGSTLVEARMLEPDLILSSDHITYTQDFLGVNAIIVENYTDSIIKDFQFEHIESGDPLVDFQTRKILSDSICKGKNYALFLDLLSKNFGSPKLISRNPIGERTEEHYEFKNKAGTLIFLESNGITKGPSIGIGDQAPMDAIYACRFNGKYVPSESK